MWFVWPRPPSAGCRGRTTDGCYRDPDRTLSSLAYGNVDLPPATSKPLSPFEQKRAQLAGTLAAIEGMDLTALRALWTEHFGTPPSLRSRELMRLTLSWCLQARAHGGLDAAMRRSLRRPTRADPGSAIDLDARHLPVRHSSPATQYGRRLLGLAFIAPDLQQAILEGSQPADLTLEHLLAKPLPDDWVAQRKLFDHG